MKGNERFERASGEVISMSSYARQVFLWILHLVSLATWPEGICIQAKVRNTSSTDVSRFDP